MAFRNVPFSAAHLFPFCACRRCVTIMPLGAAAVLIAAFQMRGYLLKLVGGLAIPLLAVLVGVWGYSFINDVGGWFSWRSSRWEVVCRSGRLLFDNAPQREDE